MTTETVSHQYKLDEDDSRKIISSPRTVIKNTGVFNDLKLSKTDRMQNAERILKMQVVSLSSLLQAARDEDEVYNYLSSFQCKFYLI
ncbi:hypothetical protein [Rossellomorea vietnamensis]|uniref:Uncharacterized protein n=1 Tax=Rossellomorea vietnamensis TaxID=218284 RepID=A0A0P6W2Y4_9BACI|nr:hypothetical protein [Rossellomorea vietnamensis]KPL60457.1 hypothetical protein AM506_04815 [Rossellomorea vietnamensis]